MNNTRFILRHSLALLMLSLFLSCSGNQGGMSLLRVQGNRFVNAEGDTVRLHGLCIADPVKLLAEDQWNNTIFATAREWGANVVRITVHPINVREFGWNEYFEELDKGIQWAKANNLYVVIDWQSCGNLKDGAFHRPMHETTVEETINFWKEIATRYREEPTMAFYEIFNEPTARGDAGVDLGTEDWAAWRVLEERIIDEIRAINPDALVLCAGYDWAYDLKPVTYDPVQRENIAYVSHPYPMKRPEPWPETWEADFGFAAKDYAVFCTEIGYCYADDKGAHNPVIATDAYAEQITEFLAERGISFCVWCFDTGYNPVLISDWDYTPTNCGRFFKNYLQSIAK